jgi:hypothetical protein
MALPASPTSIATYGMPVNDYAPVTDPTTDQSAAGANQGFCDLSMMTNTSIKAVVALQTNNTSAPVLISHAAQWGTGTAPTLARTGVGTYTVTWPATVTDQLGASQAVNLTFAVSGISQTLALGVSLAVSANVATVKAYNTTTGATFDGTGAIITIAVM